MKKKGFTLIELLAVIVVLAIIALIATPIVMNVIKNFSAGAAERSADNYVKAVETLIATEKLDGTPLVDGTYTIESDGTIKGNGETYTVEVSGTKPNGGTIVVKEGQVVKDSSTIDYKDYTVTYKDGKAEAKEKVASEFVCAPVSEEELQFEYPAYSGVSSYEQGVYTTGNKSIGDAYRCTVADGLSYIFNIIKTDEEKTVLLMSDNIDDDVMTWCLSGNDNSCNGDGVWAALEAKTSSWTNSDIEEVTLPSYDLIHPLGYQNWLQANIHGPVIENPPYGYWTSTAAAPSTSAYVVDVSGGLTYMATDGDGYVCYGIRPVIVVDTDLIA